MKASVRLGLLLSGIRNCRGHGVECRGGSRVGRTAAGRRVEICCRLERESRVPVCRLWQPQQHDIVRLRGQRQHADKQCPRTRQHRALRRQLHVRLLIDAREVHRKRVAFFIQIAGGTNRKAV
jgi:hypothetical protein